MRLLEIGVARHLEGFAPGQDVVFFWEVQTLPLSQTSTR
jgi:hypothetical protein